jgi:hypothetical protein
LYFYAVVARQRALPHTHQWLGTYGGAGNGDDRGELLRAVEAITSYVTPLSIPLEQVIVRLDGLSGNTAPVVDLLRQRRGVIGRSKEYSLLDVPQVQARLALPPDEQTTHPETGISRALFDCPNVSLGVSGVFVRLIVATHPARSSHALRIEEDLQGPLFLSNPMEQCAV